MLEIEQWKLLSNSNGYNFSLGGPIQAHNILRCSKLNNGCSREIQKVITFHSEARFRSIIYRDSRNWITEAFENFKLSKHLSRRSDSGAQYIEMLEIEQWKLLSNSNGHNFSHGCQIQAHNISRRSKLNNGNSREIQMLKTFHSEVRFRRIIFRDARNWTTETLEKFKCSKLFTRRSDSGT